MSAYYQSVTTILMNYVTLYVRVALDRSLPAELLVFSILYALPCYFTCRQELLRTLNTFLALFALRPTHRYPIRHRTLPPA